MKTRIYLRKNKTSKKQPNKQFKKRNLTKWNDSVFIKYSVADFFLITSAIIFLTLEQVKIDIV